MRTREEAEPVMRQRCIRLDREADEYLRALIPQRTGVGAFIGRLVLEHKLRHELTRQQSHDRQESQACLGE